MFQYKCDNLYTPLCEGAIAWNDFTLGITWKKLREKKLFFRRKVLAIRF
ncbi:MULTISPECIES: dTDP-4-dehydrorhamnose 3,5-epimerase family protein [Bacteroides]|nr:MULTISPECIES: dTDP-4-dehydrorhamnose 3,5-epimerase family protein [Bacteroides]